MRPRRECDDRSRIAALLAAALEPPRAPDPPPAWLRPGQIASFARALAALRRYNTACVADPVGSGKTYIALAVAERCNRGAPTVCLVPAVLVEQWQATADRLGVRVEPHTHESTSRGRLPRGRSPLVIIDESHRFRAPATRRYGTVARWLVGASPLLLTATPVVNRPADLLHQLRLGAADDALQEVGVPSIAALLEAGSGHPALARLVIIEYGADAGRPRRSARCIPVPDSRAVMETAAQLDRLRLSSAPDVAALVRVSLLRALASSPAAFRAALGRYRGLLRHAADAAAAGRPVTRRQLRSAVGADDSQLVLWRLLDASADAAVELDPGDLPLLETMMSPGAGVAAGAAHARVAARAAFAGTAATSTGRAATRRAATTAHPPAPDAKAAALAELLRDGLTTIVFVTHRATVPYLRDLLSGARVAWCTGTAAGIGRLRASRRAVLAAFNPAARTAADPAPASVLIATDVAAEGLDLQRAERIVHYDLPWTPMRLRQREGRALRLGSVHARVDVVRFVAPPAIERRLGMGRVLRRKEAWPSRLGLSAQRDIGTPVSSRRSGLLVVGAAECKAGVEYMVLWHGEDGRTVDDPVVLGAALRSLPAGVRLVECSTTARGPAVMLTRGPAGAPDPVSAEDAVADSRTTDSPDVEAAPDALPDPLAGAGPDDTPAAAPLNGAGLHAALATNAALFEHAERVLARHRRGLGASRAPTLRRVPAGLVRRVFAFARSAARARDDERLALVERACEFLGRAHSAGEAMLVAELTVCDPRRFGVLLAQLPSPPGASQETPRGWRVAAVVVVPTG